MDKLKNGDYVTGVTRAEYNMMRNLTHLIPSYIDDKGEDINSLYYSNSYLFFIEDNQSDNKKRDRIIYGYKKHCLKWHTFPEFYRKLVNTVEKDGTFSKKQTKYLFNNE